MSAMNAGAAECFHSDRIMMAVSAHMMAVHVFVPTTTAVRISCQEVGSLRSLMLGLILCDIEDFESCFQTGYQIELTSLPVPPPLYMLESESARKDGITNIQITTIRLLL